VPVRALGLTAGKRRSTYMLDLPVGHSVMPGVHSFSPMSKAVAELREEEANPRKQRNKECWKPRRSQAAHQLQL
jgi:hypothetical protein